MKRTPTGRRAVAYVRISSDRQKDNPERQGLGVARQEEACRNRANELGWTLGQVYRDNDVSASTGKPRPAYQQMLADMRCGLIDAVIVWDLDRLTRRPIEIEEFIELADQAGVSLASCSGDVDLSTDNGRLFARIKGAVARAEVERKGERQRAANQQRAAAGHWHSGPRCFGYTKDGTGLVAEEAEAYRAAIASILGGGTVRGVARDWKQRGLLTRLGRPWAPTEVRRLLVNPRHAGIAMYRGERTGVPPAWPAIIDEDTHDEVVALLSAPERRRPGRPVSYLLSGIARCGLCGGRIYGRAEARGRIYVCSSAAHLARRIEALDDFVDEYMVGWLEQEEVARALDAPVQPGDRERLRHLRGEQDRLEAGLDSLMDAFSDGRIPLSRFDRGTLRMQAQLDAVNAEVTILTQRNDHPLLSRLVEAQDKRAEWLSTPVEERREVIGQVLEITVHPAGRGARRFDPSTLSVKPRLKSAPAKNPLTR